MSDYNELTAQWETSSRRWEARALAAEAKLAKVEALAKKWDRPIHGQVEDSWMSEDFARRLREAIGEKP